MIALQWLLMLAGLAGAVLLVSGGGALLDLFLRQED